MAFPQLLSVTETSISTPTTTHNVQMPASVTSGDLLIINTAYSALVSATAPSGWTEIVVDGIYCIYAKLADGTEGGTTVAIVVSASCNTASQCLQIGQWFGDISTGLTAGILQSGSGVTPDPPSVTASWGTDDNMFIASFGGYNDDATLISGPSGYSNLNYTITGGGINLGAEVGTATLNSASNSENPGVFTISESESWRAQTIAVRPGTSGGGGGGNTYSVECSDGVNLSDSISSSSIISAILSDGMTASDTPESSINMNVSFSDSVDLNDVVSTFSQIQAIMSELSTFTDSATTEKPPIEVLCSDSVTITDGTESSITMNVSCPDGIVLSDFAQAVAIIASSCSDGVALTDTFIDSTFLPQGVVTITGYSAKLKITFNVVAKPTITGGNA